MRNVSKMAAPVLVPEVHFFTDRSELKFCNRIKQSTLFKFSAKIQAEQIVDNANVIWPLCFCFVLSRVLYPYIIMTLK